MLIDKIQITNRNFSIGRPNSIYCFSFDFPYSKRLELEHHKTNDYDMCDLRKKGDHSLGQWKIKYK